MLAVRFVCTMASSGDPLTYDPWSAHQNAHDARSIDPTFEPIYSYAMPTGRARVRARLITGESPTSLEETWAYAGIEVNRRPNVRRPPRDDHSSDDEAHDCHRIIANNLGDIQFDSFVRKRYLLAGMDVRAAQLLTISEPEINGLTVIGGGRDRVSELRTLLGIESDEAERMTSKVCATQYINRSVRSLQKLLHPDKTNGILSALGVNDPERRKGYMNLMAVAYLHMQTAMEAYSEYCSRLIDRRIANMSFAGSVKWVAQENMHRLFGYARGN